MFSGCSALTSIDVSGFDTSNVTSMAYMFSGCSGLTSIEVSGFDTSNVTDMHGMFGGCKNLTILDFQVYSKLLIDRVNNDIKRMEKSGNSMSGILSLLLNKLT
jgi:surface protein